MKPLTHEELGQAIARQFPPEATSWAQATDEVRDLCRWAREMAGVHVDQAVDFRAMVTPAQWNTQGIAGIIKFYKMLNPQKQLEFCTEYALYWSIETH